MFLSDNARSYVARVVKKKQEWLKKEILQNPFNVLIYFIYCYTEWFTAN